MAEQRKIARAWARSRVGQTLQVLVEGRADEAEKAPADQSSGEHGLICRSAGPAPGATFAGCSVARSEADAPDIDGRVYIRGALRAGQFARVRIIGHTDYDLIAEPA
jgi:ribosomal protein S12 methylthiotransferase